MCAVWVAEFLPRRYLCVERSSVNHLDGSIESMDVVSTTTCRHRARMDRGFTLAVSYSLLQLPLESLRPHCPGVAAVPAQLPEETNSLSLASCVLGLCPFDLPLRPG